MPRLKKTDPGRNIQNPIAIEIDEHEEVKCRGINNVRFSNVKATGSQYPHFKGRSTTPPGSVSFYNCSFSSNDEARRAKGFDVDLHESYAENVRFVNTDFN